MEKTRDWLQHQIGQEAASCLRDSKEKRKVIIVIEPDGVPTNCKMKHRLELKQLGLTLQLSIVFIALG